MVSTTGNRELNVPIPQLFVRPGKASAFNSERAVTAERRVSARFTPSLRIGGLIVFVMLTAAVAAPFVAVARRAVLGEEMPALAFGV